MTYKTTIAFSAEWEATGEFPTHFADEADIVAEAIKTLLDIGGDEDRKIVMDAIEADHESLCDETDQPDERWLSDYRGNDRFRDKPVELDADNLDCLKVTLTYVTQHSFTLDALMGRLDLDTDGVREIVRRAAELLTEKPEA